MPFVLLIAGALAIASAIKGTYAQLGQQIITDMKGSAGSPGYLYWVSAIIMIGALGYYAPLQKFSRAFMVLIIIGMVLATKGGVFSKLTDALKNPVEPPQTSGTPQGSATAPASGQQSSLQSGAQALSTATELIDTAAIALA
jgi:hypothetical protein